MKNLLTGVVNKIVGNSNNYRISTNSDGSVELREYGDKHLQVLNRDGKFITEFYTLNEIYQQRDNKSIRINTKTRVFSTEVPKLNCRVIKDGLNYSSGYIHEPDANYSAMLNNLVCDDFKIETVVRCLVSALTTKYLASFKIEEIDASAQYGIPEIHAKLSHTVRAKRDNNYTSEILITVEGNAYRNGVLIGCMIEPNKFIALDGHFEEGSILERYRQSSMFSTIVDVDVRNNELIIDAHNHPVMDIVRYMIKSTSYDYFKSITIDNWCSVMDGLSSIRGIKNLKLSVNRPFNVKEIKKLTNLRSLHIKCEWLENVYGDALEIMKNLKKLKTLVVHTTDIIPFHTGNTARLLYNLKKELPDCRIRLYGEVIPEYEFHKFTTDKYDESEKIEFHFTDYMHGSFAMDENTDLSIHHNFNIIDDIHIPLIPTRIHGLNVIGNELITTNVGVLKQVSHGVYLKANNIDIYGDMSKLGSKEFFTIEGNVHTSHSVSWDMFSSIGTSLNLRCDLNLYGDMNVLDKGLRRLKATEIGSSHIDVTEFDQLEYLDVVSTKISGVLSIENRTMDISIGDNCNIDDLVLTEIKGEGSLLSIKINTDARDIKFNKFLNHVRCDKNFNCTTRFADGELIISINAIK